MLMYHQTIAEVPLEQHSKPTRGEQYFGEIETHGTVGKLGTAIERVYPIAESWGR